VLGLAATALLSCSRRGTAVAVAESPPLAAGGASPACPKELEPEECAVEREFGGCWDVYAALGDHHRPSRTAVSRCAADCNAGALLACLRLANYEDNFGDEKQQEESAGLYFRACDEGQPEACLSAAQWMAIGVDTLIYDAAVPGSLLYRECRGDAADGCLRARAEVAARKDVHDRVKAFEESKRGCQAGFPLACVAVASAKVHGDGVHLDEREGYAELDALCTGGDVTACATLIFGSARGTSARCDYEWKTCKLGASFACTYACAERCSALPGEPCETVRAQISRPRVWIFPDGADVEEKTGK
jgi:TPR repeat protein